MFYQWVKVLLLAGALHGLCASAQANTTIPAVPAWPQSTQSFDQSSAPILVAQTDLALPPPPTSTTYDVPVAPIPARTGQARIALLLPLRSPILGTAAAAVRDGFLLAHELDPVGITVSVIATGDAPGETVSAYLAARGQHDIVVGPLTRSDVSAVASSGGVTKPTIALSAPEGPTGARAHLPAQMVPLGLSIEDEARQVADWMNREHPLAKAYVVHTGGGWQQRAAFAFASRWQRMGRDLELMAVEVTEGFLHGEALKVLRQKLHEDRSVVVFAALDAWEARQLRETTGHAVPFYGTSQLNPLVPSMQTEEEAPVMDGVITEPLVLTDPMTGPQAEESAEAGETAEPDNSTGLEELNGAYLLDIPWQLHPEHPAVMLYRDAAEVAGAEEGRGSADLERLYALGIDAYRVAREIASGHTAIELDGVTGKLSIRMGGGNGYFERVMQRATFRDGRAVPLETP